jgi:excisionase family DNA binding protein
LTVAQVVERLNVSELNVRHPIFQRRIGVVKIGRLVRIDERQLEEFIDLPCTYLKGAASPFPLISGGGNAVLGE